MGVEPEKRRQPSVGVKLQAALLRLEWAYRKLGLIEEGQDVEGWDFDHVPMLALRSHDPETGAHVPHQHDPEHLIPMPRHAHREKTHGRRGESKLSRRGGDILELKKARHQAAKEAAFRARLLATDRGESPPPTKRKKHKIQSRNDLRRPRKKP